MQPDTLIASAVFAAVAVPLSLWIGFGTKRRDADDAAARVNFEPAELPKAELIASQCSQCGAVRCTDKRWRAAREVPLPAGCTVSHGLCPVCFAATVRHDFSAAHYGGGLAAGTQPKTPRPALAGAGTL